MLEPQTRAALTEQLAPPYGYELSYAVGTTFTLDLATALSIPLSFASRRVSVADGSLGVLEAVRRASERMDVFAQAGEMSMGQNSDLVAFLEQMVHPVALKKGLFHPKLWLLQYASGERRTHRLLCSSRNLTDDHSWDAFIRLDERDDSERSDEDLQRLNAPLVQLLNTLPDMAIRPIDKKRRQRVQQLARHISLVDWELPDRMRELAFHVRGLHRSPLPDFSGIRSLLISPYVSGDGLRLLRDGVREDTYLVSRTDSLDQLPPEALDTELVTYVLDDAASLDIAGASDSDTGAVPLSGLHAKVIVADRQDGAHIILGSANATDAAWYRNVEVMVELVAAKDSFGVKATLDALGELKAEYQTTGGAEPNESDQAKHRLESVMRGMAATRLTVRVHGENPYELRVWADADFAVHAEAAASEGIELRWHLLTRADLGGRSLPVSEKDAASLTDLKLVEITPFIVLEGRDRLGNTRRTVLLAELLNDVESRRDAIIARQLKDRTTFIRLLVLMLELSGVGVPDELLSASIEGGSAGSMRGTAVGSGLFEALMKSVAGGHERLAEVQHFIEFLRKDDEKSDLLTPDFEVLWSNVWQAQLALKGAGQ